MADQFVTPITSEIESLGHSWNVVVQASPRIRDDGAGTLTPAPPAVIIVPKNKEVKVHAMGVDGPELNIRSFYDVFFVTLTLGENVLDPDHDDFVVEMVSQFMPMPASISTAGAWQTRVAPSRDVDRTLFGKSYITSQVVLSVDWIQ